MYHCVSPTEDGVVQINKNGVVGLGVTEDGGEKALTGAGVTRGARETDAAPALLGSAGERRLSAVAVTGPEGTEHGAVV